MRGVEKTDVGKSVRVSDRDLARISEAGQEGNHKH
jgi:hypothetical protein